ncbi:Aste57867_14519 [Aphanomyces stellatus]|uniref:Aste57867_14519 protein n=1 Tax=Aphanomyces stellatus TaxID=120398 RepID=A0A485L3C2_9STRA|nr:hypothetical protein As57867_014465 [Aphanomyces stellatus]VFT91341.1 Aste57867_14519 [Aphanomyces stellatus]
MVAAVAGSTNPSRTDLASPAPEAVDNTPVGDVDVEESDRGDAALGGAMRNALRSAISRVRLQNPIVGSFPRTPVPAKAVASASDNLSFLMDVTGYIKEAQDHVAEKATTPKAKASILAKWATTTWVPNLVRASLLGARSATWTSYEMVSDQLIDPAHSSTPSTNLSIMLPWVLGASVTAGAVAGTVHGSLWSASERAITAFKREPFAYRLPGVILSHGTTHLAMFSSYEASKVVFLTHMQEDPTQVPLQGAFCIVGAAAISGFVGEIATHFAGPFELQSFQAAKEEIRTSRLPSLRTMAPSAFSTMLGWLAYEFAKDSLETTTSGAS